MFWRKKVRRLHLRVLGKMHAYWLLFVWVLIKVMGNWLIKAKITAQESSHISRAYLLPFCLLHAWFLSDSHVFLGSSFFHTLGKAPCMTCRRWLGWRARVKQCSLKWTEHITNLVPGLRLNSSSWFSRIEATHLSFWLTDHASQFQPIN